MHVETTRILRAWLEHPTYGLEAMLPAIGRLHTPDTDGEQAEDDVPAVPAFYDDVDSDGLAGVDGVTPPELPALVLVVDSDPRSTDIGQPDKPAAEMVLNGGLGYYAEDTGREQGVRDANYILRAAWNSLRWYNQPRRRVKATGYLTELNGVKVVKVQALTVQRMAGAVGRGTLLAVLVFDVIVLNTYD
ncbi:MAG: hypothetical protein H0W72_05130 [Planctomycetes bacterium]|nr:hypothetical protein [Planctomycetota bacterium]